MKKIKLYTPGPLEYFPFVKKAMRKKLHHRSENFREIVKRIRKNFSKILKADPPVLLASSGTGAVNAVFQNFVKKKEKCLVLSNGKFGNRIAKIMEFYDVDYEVVKAMPGEVFDTETVLKSVKNKSFLFMTFVETSTGTKNNVEEIIKKVKKENPEIKIVVDGISAIGAYEIYPEKLEIDVLIGASHKAFGCPPGISFVWFSEEMKAKKPNDFYFNLAEEKRHQDEKYEFRFTPPVEVVSALDASLDFVSRDFKSFVQRHERISNFFRKNVEKEGLKLFSKSPANTLSAVKVKDAEKIYEMLRKSGYLVGKGSEDYKNIIRVSHMGNVKKKELREIAELMKVYNDQIETKTL